METDTRESREDDPETGAYAKDPNDGQWKNWIGGVPTMPSDGVVKIYMDPSDLPTSTLHKLEDMAKRTVKTTGRIAEIVNDPKDADINIHWEWLKEHPAFADNPLGITWNGWLPSFDPGWKNRLKDNTGFSHVEDQHIAIDVESHKDH